MVQDEKNIFLYDVENRLQGRKNRRRTTNRPKDNIGNSCLVIQTEAANTKPCAIRKKQLSAPKDNLDIFCIPTKTAREGRRLRDIPEVPECECSSEDSYAMNDANNAKGKLKASTDSKITDQRGKYPSYRRRKSHWTISSSSVDQSSTNLSSDVPFERPVPFKPRDTIGLLQHNCTNHTDEKLDKSRRDVAKETANFRQSKDVSVQSAVKVIE